MLAEKEEDIQRALDYYEEAFLVLKVHFEPSRVEYKYYQQKQSELRFHMERLSMSKGEYWEKLQVEIKTD